MFKDVWQQKIKIIEADLIKELHKTESLDENLMRAMDNGGRQAFKTDFIDGGG